MSTPRSYPKTREARNAPKAAVSPKNVDPVWLLKAAVAVVAVGLLCAYLTVCALFFVEQWQLVLHPSRAVPRTPASMDLAFEPVRFGDDRSGQPQLTGWWIPGDSGQAPTVLLLHGEDGSMSEALPAALALHRARLNVLLFDYRGYGASGGKHPTEQLMRSDADSAFLYLTQTRGIAPGNIVVYGMRLGASLAVSLCAKYSGLPALILESADGDTETRVLRDVRTRAIPVHLLFHQRFPLADALHRLGTPKLLISYTPGAPPEEAQRAADPKLTIELPKDAGTVQFTAAIRRFLDTYVAQAPPSL